MSKIRLKLDWFTEIKRGNIPGHSLIHKFGHNETVGTSLKVITASGNYLMATANTALEIVSDDVNDDVTGTGARKVFIQGLTLTGGLFVPEEEEVAMDGTNPVVLGNTYVRIFRAWVSESGTYASLSTASQAGTISVRPSGGGTDYLIIDELAGDGVGQSQAAMYTTPTNSESILYAPIFTIETTKTASVYFFQRPNADDVTTPFTGAKRLVQEWHGVATSGGIPPMVPVAYFTGAVDMGFMAESAVGTAKISAEFWLVQIDT